MTLNIQPKLRSKATVGVGARCRARARHALVDISFGHVAEALVLGPCYVCQSVALGWPVLCGL
jgi:hypothetical protein